MKDEYNGWETLTSTVEFLNTDQPLDNTSIRCISACREVGGMYIEHNDITEHIMLLLASCGRFPDMTWTDLSDINKYRRFDYPEEYTVTANRLSYFRALLLLFDSEAHNMTVFRLDMMARVYMRAILERNIAFVLFTGIPPLEMMDMLVIFIWIRGHCSGMNFHNSFRRDGRPTHDPRRAPFHALFVLSYVMENPDILSGATVLVHASTTNPDTDTRNVTVALRPDICDRLCSRIAAAVNDVV